MDARFAASEQRGRVLRAWPRGEPGCRRRACRGRHRRALSRRRTRGVEERRRKARPQAAQCQYPLGDARAAQNRSHCLPVAHREVRRRRRAIPLRPVEDGARCSEAERRGALRRSGRPLLARRRALQLRRLPQALSVDRPGAHRARHDRARRRHGPPRARRAGAGARSHLPRAIAQLPGRPPDARARHGDVRRALYVVQGRQGRVAYLESAGLPLSYSLWQLVQYMAKLGTIGFGGPVALVGYMQRDLVEQRKWISESDFKEGLTLAQLMPGPLAAQLAIYLGYVHYGVTGATA